MGTFSALLALCGGLHRSHINSPHKGQWRTALMFSLICAWTNGWVNNRDAGDLKRHRAHYDVTIMAPIKSLPRTQAQKKCAMINTYRATFYLCLTHLFTQSVVIALLDVNKALLKRSWYMQSSWILSLQRNRWQHSDVRGQVLSSQCIDLVFPNYSFLHTRMGK